MPLKLSEIDSNKVKVVGGGDAARPLKLSELGGEQVRVVKEGKGFTDEEIAPYHAAIAGAAQGLTLGHTDEIIGGLGAAYDKLTGSGESIGELYEKNRDDRRDAYDRVRAKYPGTFTSAEVAGGVAPAFLTGGASLFPTGVKGAVAAGAAGGATAGLGYSDADNAGELLQDVAEGGAVGGVGGGVISAGVTGAGKLLGAADDAIPPAVRDWVAQKAQGGKDFAKTAARKSLSWLGNVDDRVSQRYLKRPNEINEITPDAVYDEVSGALGGLRGAVETAKNKFEIAKSEKSTAEKLLKEQLRREMVPASSVDDVAQALDKVRNQASNLSTESYSKLMEADKVFKVAPFKAKLTTLIKDFDVAGKAPEGDLKPAFYDKLVSWRDTLDTLGKGASAQDLKTVIQQLDEDLAAAYQASSLAGGKPTRGERALKELRGQINKSLRQIKPYAEVMDKLSATTRLSKDANKLFQKNPLGALEKSINPKNPQHREILERLRAETGIDLTSGLDDLAASKAALSDTTKFQALANELPETKAMQSAEGALEAAQAAADPIGGINANTLISKGKNPANIKENRALEYVDKVSGGKTKTMIDDLGAKNAFNADSTGGRGHRYAIIGTMIGAKAGGAYGMAGGAAAGAMLDKNAGKITKAGLDFGMSVAKRPGAQKIGQLIPYLPAKFAETLTRAAQRGPESVGAAHFILWKNNQEYRDSVEKTLMETADSL